MSRKSTIEWTNSTWNPVTGCTKGNAGCGGKGVERGQAGWTEGVKQRNLAEFFANPFLRLYTVCRKFSC